MISSMNCIQRGHSMPAGARATGAMWVCKCRGVWGISAPVARLITPDRQLNSIGLWSNWLFKVAKSGWQLASLSPASNAGTVCSRCPSFFNLRCWMASQSSGWRLARRWTSTSTFRMCFATFTIRLRASPLASGSQWVPLHSIQQPRPTSYRVTSPHRSQKRSALPTSLGE